MELGLTIERSAWWKRPRYLALSCVLLALTGLLALQGGSFNDHLNVSSTLTHGNITNADVELKDVAHGHDQDLYRNFVMDQWQYFESPGVKQKYPNLVNKLPKKFGLCYDCPGASEQWHRMMSIAAMCLDYNKDVREAQKHRNVHCGSCIGWSSERFFTEVKARYSRWQSATYSKNLVFIKELLRYQNSSSVQNSGFVAYNRRAQELLVVVQGSMTPADGTYNFQALGVNFQQFVLDALGVKRTKGPYSLREHWGYAQITSELYPQVMSALAEAQERYGSRSRNITKIVVTGHSLGSAVGAGLLKVLDNREDLEPSGFLYAQPNSFKLGFLAGFFTSFWTTVLSRETTMRSKVINIHNVYDPVVVASEKSFFVPLGTEWKFTGMVEHREPR